VRTDHCGEREMKSLLLSIVILTVIFADGVPAGRRFDGPSTEPAREELQHNCELIYKGDYDRALNGFASIAAAFPSSPAGDFYKVVTLIWKSRVDAKLDAGSRDFDSQIESLIDSVVTKAEEVKANTRADKRAEIDSLYYLGSAAAIRARVALYQNHGIPAAKQARLAQDLFGDLLGRHPDYFDGYYAPGVIYYAVGQLTDSPLGKLVVNLVGQKSLPTGDMERGLSYLQKAASKAPLASVDAKLALLEIYALNENKYELALPIAAELRSRYPDNQTFARYMMKVYAGLNDKKKLAETARDVLSRVKQKKPNFGLYVKAEAERYLAEAGTQ